MLLYRFIQFVSISLIMGGCFNMPVKSNGNVTVLNSEARVAVSKAVEGTKAISSFDPNAKVATVVQAPSGKLSASSVTLSPGALMVATDLVIEEAVPLSETSVSTSLNISANIKITPVGAGLIIRPTTNVDLSKPLTIAMSLEGLQGLWGRLSGYFLQDAGKHYAVFYKSMIGGQLRDGVIPSSELRLLDNGNVEFEGYFGAFWLCEVSSPIETRVEAITTEPAVNIDGVSVIEKTGIVTEEQIVTKESIPVVLWNAVFLSYDETSRSVSLSSSIGADRTLKDCAADLRLSSADSSGISGSASANLLFSYAITKKEAHQLVGRFRCFDDQGRQAVSSWSLPLTVPAEPDPAVALGLSIAGGASYTSNSEVTLSLEASGAVEMYMTNSATCSSGGSWQKFASSRTWSLPSLNQKNSIFVVFRNRIGKLSSCISASIIHDDQAPTGTITIEQGANSTTLTTVALSLAATGAYQMYITNQAGCSSGGTWENYQASKSWSLAQTNATAAVYAAFRDQAGNTSPCVSDQIIQIIQQNNTNAPALATINEISQNRVELYVTQAGNLQGFSLSDQDGNTKTLSLGSVAQGSYQVIDLGFDLDWSGDDVLLIDGSGNPIDYVSWGAVNSPPAGITWNYSSPISTLAYYSVTSLSLVTNGVDQNTSAHWEATGSGRSSLLAHSCRPSNVDLNNSMGFSNTASCPAAAGTLANLVINERSGSQVELFAVTAGYTGGYVLSNQQNFMVTMPDLYLNAGEFIVVGNSYNYGYGSSSPYTVNMGDYYIEINPADDLVLLKPSATDTTTLANGANFSAIPVDYVAFGVNDQYTTNIQNIPVSAQGVTVSWDASNQGNLVGINRYSLTPNGVDTNSSVSWEISGSGSAPGPKSAGPSSLGSPNVVVNNSPGAAIINEIASNRAELYVTQAGDLGGFVLSDQDGNVKTLATQTVTVGQYIVVNLGYDLDWSNDDLLLLDNSDVPEDYVSWGSVNNPPAGISWDYSSPISTLAYYSVTSLSLVTNGVDQDTSAHWEATGSGRSSLLAHSCRPSNVDLNNSMGFSNTASCPTAAGTLANLIINERSGSQVELFAVTAGYTGGYVLSNQQNFTVTMPDLYLNAGEFIVVGNSYNYGYGSSSPYTVNMGDYYIEINPADDLVLLKPSVTDSTTLANGANFSAVPVDYVAFGVNDQYTSNIQNIPVSAQSVTVSWDASNQGNLVGSNRYSLTPNGVDTNSSVNWEISGTGTAPGGVTVGPSSMGSENTITNSNPAGAIINEIASNRVELYITQAGDLGGFTLSDQDGNIKTLTTQTVSAGQYVVVNLGFDLDWSNDDLLLIDNSDVPKDYVSWGSVNNPPAGISWDYSSPISTLAYYSVTSLSLVTNGVDQDTSAHWEATGSGRSALLAHSCRPSNVDLNNSMGFSNTASCPTAAGTLANLIINERSGNQVELFAVTAGYTGGYVLSNQQNFTVTMPDVYLNAGEFIVVGNSYNYGYGSSSPYTVNMGDYYIEINPADDLVLLKPSVTDSTSLANGAQFSAVPVDYVAFGVNDQYTTNIQNIPVSVQGVTVSWDAGNQANLVGTNKYSLTPNGLDTNSSVNWEISGSGSAPGATTAGPSSLGISNTF